MQDVPYQRAMRRVRMTVDHIDGDQSEGFLLVPVGMTHEQQLAQADQFLPFELLKGGKVFLAMRAIKRVRVMAEEAKREQQATTARFDAEGAEDGSGLNRGGKFRGSDTEAMRRRERAARMHAERMRREQAERAAAMRREAREEYQDVVEAMEVLGLPLDATTEEIHATYRRLVKNNHPDRLRGEGASEDAVRRAAERLARINRAFQTLSDDPAAA